MDEPLSNLDAQLRVEMRLEIARIQRLLGVATVYVTHDPVSYTHLSSTSATSATTDVMVALSSGVAVMSRKTSSSAPPSL